MSHIKIIEYRDEHQQYFEMLNRAWIEKFFTMEPSDIEMLTKPRQSLLDKGGAILMAEFNGVIAGTVALKKISEGIFEFTKMAVDAKYRRLGIAEYLSYGSFLKAKELNAKSIILYSNSILKGAILLYEKLGFIHGPVINSGYVRSDVKMEIPIEEAVERANTYFNQKKNFSPVK